MALEFTVTYDELTNEPVNTTAAPPIPATGWVTFETSILPGMRIAALTNLPRPAGMEIRTFKGFLDTDGQLKSEPGGTVGVRLWANDPDWRLDRLQYRVRATLTDYLGREVPWVDFYFDAPKEDVVRNLALEIPRPGQKFGRGRPGLGLTGASVNGQGQLLLSREDDKLLAAVDVPELSETLAETNAAAIAYGMTFGR